MTPALKPAKTREQLKAARERIQRRADADAYDKATERDLGCCRVCGAYHAMGMHRHHIVYRSLGGSNLTSNLCLLCPLCHADEHAHRIRISGDADRRDRQGRLCGLTISRQHKDGRLTIEGQR